MARRRTAVKQLSQIISIKCTECPFLFIHLHYFYSMNGVWMCKSKKLRLNPTWASKCVDDHKKEAPHWLKKIIRA